MMSFTRKGNSKSEGKSHGSIHVSFARSQLLLLQSRKKWGILYGLSTLSGLLLVGSSLGSIFSIPEMFTIVQKGAQTPLISFLVTVGMFVLNDLVDVDLDRANGKNRPIPSGRVSKVQAWTFILSTNVGALLLAIFSLDRISVMVVGIMLMLGVMYSAPRIGLMKRFVTKTVTIAFYYSLCALLGVISVQGPNMMDNPMVPVHGLLILAIMIFISSIFNDLGDVDGDRAAGRRTIPIVIGKDNTVTLAVILALSMILVTWVVYGLSMFIGGRGSMIEAILITLFGLVMVLRSENMRKGLNDTNSIRTFHRKMFPLNLVLQICLIFGGLFVM